MSASYEITLMGREFRIRSDDDAQHVQAVADYVNHTLSELGAGDAPGVSQQLLLMASLNLADELFKVRAEHQRLKERIRATSRSLLDRLAV